MVKVCINGGSVAGLTTALLLANDGHDVTVAERDTAPPSRDPGESWESWERRSVPQFRQSHAFLPRFRKILLEELPHVWTRLLEAGIREHDMIGNRPATVPADEAQPGDEDLVLLLGRRCTLEHVLRHAADDDPKIDLRSEVTVDGVLVDDSRHARGLATTAGALTGDVVVDCSGARTSVPGWVEAAGAARPQEDAAEFRIAYWTQWFRVRPGCDLPPLEGLPVVSIGSVQVLRMPADDGWLSMTVVAPASERKFRALSDHDTLLRLLRAHPATSTWADPGLVEPVGSILPMFTPLDSRRRYVIDDRPCLTGITGAGDAIGATNPAKGRGMTFAAMHGVGLRDTLRIVTSPAEVTVAHDSWLQEHFQSWWTGTVEADRADLNRMRAVARGDGSPPTDPASLFRHAAFHDPMLYRRFLRIAGVLDQPHEVMSDPAVGQRLQETLQHIGPPPADDIDLDKAVSAA